MQLPRQYRLFQLKNRMVLGELDFYFYLNIQRKILLRLQKETQIFYLVLLLNLLLQFLIPLLKMQLL